MQPFATTTDALVYGRTVTDIALNIASARIRGYVGARIETHKNITSDAFIEFVATLANRIDKENPSLSEGFVSATSGGESGTFGWDSFQGTTDLLTAEKQKLDRLFSNRRPPGVIVVSA